MFHARDLVIFQEMLEHGEITTLDHKQNDCWSEAPRQQRSAASVRGGGCKKGTMTGPELDKHTDSSVRGGAYKKGTMTGPEQQQHRALMAQGKTEKHHMMMQLSNGKAEQQNFLECSDSKSGTAVLYHFCADNEPTIDGVREFEKYLLDVQNGYMPGKLTKEGASARIAMEKRLAKVDSVNAARERKRKRQGK